MGEGEAVREGHEQSLSFQQQKRRLRQVWGQRTSTEVGGGQDEVTHKLWLLPGPTVPASKPPGLLAGLGSFRFKPI